MRKKGPVPIAEFPATRMASRFCKTIQGITGGAWGKDMDSIYMSVF